MIGRRAFSFGIGASIVCCCTGSAFANPSALRGGCGLVGTETSLVPPTSIDYLDGDSDGPRITSRVWGKELIDRTLTPAIERLNTSFGVSPDFGFFDDSKGKNAYAVNEQSRGREGLVLFGNGLFDELLHKDPSGISILLVLAHEYGHILQYTYNQYDSINAGQPTHKRTELSADFMAGYYMAQRKLDHPEASFWKAGRQLWSIGDFQFNDALHHGTPDERAAAANAGFESGYVQRVAVLDAFFKSVEYVSAP